jgi:hypothetical protein
MRGFALDAEAVFGVVVLQAVVFDNSGFSELVKINIQIGDNYFLLFTVIT